MGKRTLAFIALLVVAGLAFLGYRRCRGPSEEAALTQARADALASVWTYLLPRRR